MLNDNKGSHVELLESVTRQKPGVFSVTSLKMVCFISFLQCLGTLPWGAKTIKSVNNTIYTVPFWTLRRKRARNHYFLTSPGHELLFYESKDNLGLWWITSAHMPHSTLNLEHKAKHIYLYIFFWQNSHSKRKKKELPLLYLI